MNSVSPGIHPTRLSLSLQTLIRKIEAEKNWTPRRARDLLRDSGLRAEELLPWADFNHSPEASYGRRLVYSGGFFEMMVMTWDPGDCSAIHDHGHTEWGAVQIFGPAEHSVFLVQDGEISTLSRTRVHPGDVLGVGHELVHQMRNPTGTPFLTFHVYGMEDGEGPVTADARVFALEQNAIQRTHGGVFYALTEDQIERREPGPRPDFATWLRHTVELLRRLDRIEHPAPLSPDRAALKKRLVRDLLDSRHWAWFEEDLFRNVDAATGLVENTGTWTLLRDDLTAAADLQARLLRQNDAEDPFYTYAELYDDVVGLPCLQEFIAGYLRFVVERYRIEPSHTRLLSLGCGTGLVEEYLIRDLGFDPERLLGIDKSEAMIRVARRRIRAEVRDLLGPPQGAWDLTFCGLNVFQYLDPGELDRAVAHAARMTHEGGLFFGDFITPDHIRIYPNVIRSQNGMVLSLRRPRLVEQGFCTFQESEIINVNRKTGDLRITDEGRHRRFLPSLWKLRRLFEREFGGPVDVYDAVSLKPMEDGADTCPSTRVLIVARKRGR